MIVCEGTGLVVGIMGHCPVCQASVAYNDDDEVLPHRSRSVQTMGWVEKKPYNAPPPPHKHVLPKGADLDGIDGGSIYQCSCGLTFVLQYNRQYSQDDEGYSCWKLAWVWTDNGWFAADADVYRKFPAGVDPEGTRTKLFKGC